MSRLSDNLKACVTGHKAQAEPLRCLDFTANSVEIKVPEHLVIYDVRASFGASVVLRSGLNDRNQHAVSRAMELINEEVFGEFRPMLMRVRHHLYNYEHEEAALALNELQERMFTR